MEKGKKADASIDDYICSFPEHIQKKLKELRNVIKELAPEAQEKISYRMPAYFLNGNLVYFAGYAKHIGFYPGANGIEAFKNELSKYKYAKGSVQFPIEEPLPVRLIKRIVKFKLEENCKKRKRNKGGS
jgi:uncharacterized protein YdhG (YjbR/CyaY superfamily)